MEGAAGEFETWRLIDQFDGSDVDLSVRLVFIFSLIELIQNFAVFSVIIL